MAAWLDHPLSDIAAALRTGKLSPTALIDAAIARHAPVLNTYKTWDPDRARAQAEAAARAFAAGLDLGPMQGLPISVKDLYGVPGWPIFAGTPQQLPAKWTRAGPVVTALQRQLAVVMGKTNTVEFAIGTLGTNPHWGTPRNPWDPATHRVPGGSSAGAGVSLCEGTAILALGTDTAGSVRAPASYTGTVGLKTSIGRWSTDGIVPLSPTLDTAGVLARSVADIVFAFPAVDPASQADPAQFERDVAAVELSDLRLGICDDLFWEDCSPGVAEAARDAIDELVSAGATARAASVPQAPELIDMQRQASFAAQEFAAFVAAELPAWIDKLDPAVNARIRDAKDMPATVYLGRQRRRRQLIRAATGNFRGIDALVCPTIPNTPPSLAEIATGETHLAATLLSLRNTSIANLLDYCAITIPVGLDRAGMPVGLQLMAPCNADQRLLAVAGVIERTIGTAAQRLGPPPATAAQLVG